MNIDDISHEEFILLQNEIGKANDGRLSPNGVYRLKLKDYGQFPHGDFHFYFDVFKNDELQYSYETGSRVREYLNTYWACDSQTIYFSLIDKGNQIAKFETNDHSIQIICDGDSAGSLCWLSFIPNSFNGVVFTSGDTKINDCVFTQFFVYINKLDTTINLNFWFTGQLKVVPSSRTDCVNVVNEGKIYTFNVVTEKLEATIDVPSLFNREMLYTYTSNTVSCVKYKSSSVDRYLTITNF
jgi:hypothetical protein